MLQRFEETVTPPNFCNLILMNILLQEHIDYEIIQSTNPEFNKAVVRVNIFRDHRQTIQVLQYLHYGGSNRIPSASNLSYRVLDEINGALLNVVKELDNCSFYILKYQNYNKT